MLANIPSVPHHNHEGGKNPEALKHLLKANQLECIRAEVRTKLLRLYSFLVFFVCVPTLTIYIKD